jgi:hypothetical protein
VVRHHGATEARLVHGGHRLPGVRPRTVPFHCKQRGIESRGWN